MKVILFTLLLLLHFSAYAVVNINTASQAELESLEGIGPTKARAIIDHRKKNGAFNSIDELENVDGIGPSTLKRIRDQVILNGKSSTEPAVASDKHPDTPVKTKRAKKSKAKTTASAAPMAQENPVPKKTITATRPSDSTSTKNGTAKKKIIEQEPPRKKTCWWPF